MKIRCNINGLDCPHCAAKLEKMLAESEFFVTASLNFAMGTLVLEPKRPMEEETALERAQSIANSFEDGICIELRD